MVPGIGASPDKMLLGRLFAYADAHRYRIGANYNQLPVNAPHAPVHSYSTAVHMRYQLATDPDPERARRAMEAMLKMGKIEVAELRRAADAA